MVTIGIDAFVQNFRGTLLEHQALSMQMLMNNGCIIFDQNVEGVDFWWNEYWKLKPWG